jgi:hypothetical protein
MSTAPSIAIRTQVSRFVEAELEATKNMCYREAREQLNKAFADGWVTPDQYTAATEALRARESAKKYTFTSH